MTSNVDFPDTVFLGSNTPRANRNQVRSQFSTSQPKPRLNSTTPAITLVLLASLLCSCQTPSNSAKSETPPSIDRATLPSKPSFNPPALFSLPLAPDGMITVATTPTPKTLPPSSPQMVSPARPESPSTTATSKPLFETLSKNQHGHFVIAGYASGQLSVPVNAKPGFDLWTRDRSESTSYAVAGFTDSSGTTSQNKKIALSRANHVRSLLMQKGVKPDQVQVFFCTDCPSQPAKTKSPAVNPEDRRVVVSAFENSVKKPAGVDPAM